MAEHNQSEYLLELVQKAQAGDAQAFEMLYNECYEPILRFMVIRLPSIYKHNKVIFFVKQENFAVDEFLRETTRGRFNG